MPLVCINSPTQYIDFKDLYEQQLLLNTAQQNANDSLSQKIILLEFQLLELQKFIFGGKQEKFTPINTNAQQIALFGQERLGEVVVESIKHVAAHDVKKTVIRVNHPGRRPLSEHMRREEIRLLPTEDVTGLTAVKRRDNRNIRIQTRRTVCEKIHSSRIH